MSTKDPYSSNITRYRAGLNIVLALTIILSVLLICDAGCTFRSHVSEFRNAAKPDTVFIETQSIIVNASDTNNLQNKTPSTFPIEKLCEQHNATQQQILAQHEKELENLRAETNFNIDKLSAWLSFWVGIIALLGVVIPLAVQFFNYRIEKAETEKLKEELEEEIEKQKRTTSAFGIKLAVQSFTYAAENKIISAIPNNVYKIFSTRIKNEYKKFIEAISSDKNIIVKWSEVQSHIYSVLIYIIEFLSKIDERSDHYRQREIKILRDEIGKTLDELTHSSSYTEISDNLQEIGSLLDKTL